MPQLGHLELVPMLDLILCCPSYHSKCCLVLRTVCKKETMQFLIRFFFCCDNFPVDNFRVDNFRVKICPTKNNKIFTYLNNNSTGCGSQTLCNYVSNCLQNATITADQQTTGYSWINMTPGDMSKSLKKRTKKKLDYILQLTMMTCSSRHARIFKKKLVNCIKCKRGRLNVIPNKIKDHQLCAFKCNNAPSLCNRSNCKMKKKTRKNRVFIRPYTFKHT